MTVAAKVFLKLADHVWITVAMLHQRHPERMDFAIEEIMDSARGAKGPGLGGQLRKGFYVHVVQHCVANRPPSPARYRMLVETATGRRRLFRPGDSYHPGREGGRAIPKRENLPENWYSGLLGWYQNWNSDVATERIKNDPLLALYGSGKHIWADEHADEYIRRLREGWE